MAGVTGSRSGNSRAVTDCYHIRGNSLDEHRFTRSSVKALELIRQNNSTYGKSMRDLHFEWISYDLWCYRTVQSHADFPIVCVGDRISVGLLPHCSPPACGVWLARQPAAESASFNPSMSRGHSYSADRERQLTVSLVIRNPPNRQGFSSTTTD